MSDGATRRATVRVHTGIGRDRESDRFHDWLAYVWDNRSDTATLRNDHGRFVDEVSWGHHRDHCDDDRRHGGDRCDGHHD
ncbi:hypothetical protein AQJ11_44505 [Streptomyces corchorusii]|uniref:Uncharacterized protein n=1 Tax=Streptomyces corchorusii TaxID=1903 RepID=A0A117Q8F5_STRCK|nr:hypothetical protein AQJ11_44505 [Streptomyces corchorusii]